ncbi:DUF4352 domain-containing protein [Gracilibacillus dipsosauri]|uniref:DUF4352 domain-containing protein n=1 Tax=Gracilibacillus dipsosauri TaxID=178340 RepID=UPI00240A7B95
MATEGKPKKSIFKRWWFWVIAVIIVILIIPTGEEEEADAGGKKETEPKSEETAGASEEKTEEDTAKEEEKEEPKVAGIGEAVKVGDVIFTVHGKSTADNVGGEFGDNAQGIYLIVDVSVKNDGKEAITTDTSFFKLKVGDTEYEADSSASIFANEDAEFFLQQVNPGIESRGKVVFDVPEDVVNSSEVLLNVQTGFFGTEQGQINIAE